MRGLKISGKVDTGHEERLFSKGFTLIELLVVIAIISVLAAILFPVFARARENARRASCMNNLKQLSLGMLQYTQDYDEHFPMYYVCDSTATPGCGPYGWADSLQPYLKSYQVLQCPSDSNPPSNVPTSTHYTDYAYHIWLGGYYSEFGVVHASGLSLSTLTQPSLSVALADINPNGLGGGTASSYMTGCYPSWKSCGNFATGYTKTDTGLAYLPGSIRHLDGANLAFADGHVKWYKGDLTTNRLLSVYSSGTPQSVSGNNATFNPIP